MEPEKTQPELVPVVPSEDKLSMSLHSEESTKLSISSVKDPERHASDLTRAWLRSSETRSSLLLRVLVNPTLTPLRRRMRSRELPRVTDEQSVAFTMLM